MKWPGLGIVSSDQLSIAGTHYHLPPAFPKPCEFWKGPEQVLTSERRQAPRAGVAASRGCTEVRPSPPPSPLALRPSSPGSGLSLGSGSGTAGAVPPLHRPEQAPASPHLQTVAV